MVPLVLWRFTADKVREDEWRIVVVWFVVFVLVVSLSRTCCLVVSLADTQGKNGTIPLHQQWLARGVSQGAEAHGVR